MVVVVPNAGAAVLVAVKKPAEGFLLNSPMALPWVLDSADWREDGRGVVDAGFWGVEKVCIFVPPSLLMVGLDSQHTRYCYWLPTLPGSWHLAWLDEIGRGSFGGIGKFGIPITCT